jgi:hypothetical protein
MTKVFDILYYDENDKSRGGRLAIKDSYNEDDELFDDYFDDDELNEALGRPVEEKGPCYGERGFNIIYKYDEDKDVTKVKIKYLRY